MGANQFELYTKLNYDKYAIYNNNFIIFNKTLVLKNINKLFFNFFIFYFLNFEKYSIIFIKNILLYKLLNNINIKIRRVYLYLYCGFTYAKIFLKVGLGFRKKYSLTTNLYNLFIGRRKWITFKMEPSSFFFNIRRRNIFMFCNSKNKLYNNIMRLKHVRKETVYKVKGIMSLNRIIFNRRISRSIIFARRVKFRKMKLKLTKKQKSKK